MMKIKDLEKYSNAEKIILAEQLWDSIAKKNIEVTDAVKYELDERIQRLEEGKAELYTLDEVKAHLKKIR